MRRIITTLLLAFIVLAANSQTAKRVNFEFRAGLNIGGASPIPLPEEIREIKGFNPGFNYSGEADANIRLDKRNMWGIVTGIRFETKSMTTDAAVKDYSMEIIGKSGEKIAGRWTGDVNTYYSSMNWTLPILASLKPCRNFKVQLGPYFSYVMNQEFSGYVSNGYLRQGDPRGEKVVFKDGATGPYNFSDNLYNFQYGAMLGVNWEVSKHVVVAGHLSWSFRNIFQDDFKTITFSLYPIYMNVSVGYKLFPEFEKKKKH